MCTRRPVTSTYLRQRGVIFPFTISEVRTIMIHGQFNRAILSRDLWRFTPLARSSGSPNPRMNRSFLYTGTRSPLDVSPGYSGTIQENALEEHTFSNTLLYFAITIIYYIYNNYQTA